MPGTKTSTARQVAFAHAPLALNAQGQAPSRIMLLPLPGPVRTVDGRGPWKVPDPQRLVAVSTQAAAQGLMPIDENHSIDLAAPHGGSSPARGWMRDLEVAADGIYAAVNWTSTGAELVATQAYRGISVAFEHTADNTVTCIRRAALVNNPNLRDVPALNAEEEATMDLLAKLRAALGLDANADADAVCAAVTSLKSGTATALNAQLAPIAKAAGAKDGADAATVLAAVGALATARPDQTVITSLQAELTTVTTALNAMRAERATERATAFVDGAIKAGRVGVKPMREHYIKRHALNAEGATAVEAEINAMPILGPSGARIDPPAQRDGNGNVIVALNAEQREVCKALGIKEDDYKKTLAAEQAAGAA